jgi:nucleoside phosphorylase
MTQIPGAVYRPNIAILTALPKEHAAVKVLLDDPISHTETDHQGTRHYTFGSVPSRSGGRHALVLVMVGVGNGISAVATTQLLNDLPSVRTVILSGIAGGVPNVKKAEDHVRLGDIVVSNEYGVIQYDFVKDEMTKVIPRHPPRPASSNLVRAARMLEAEAIFGLRPWEAYIDQVLSALAWKRPPTTTDVLVSSDDQSKTLRHPRDPLRTNKKPRVFLGAIAASNTLLKNPIRRDQLRDLFGVKAVDMEGSGTADAAWMSQAHHFVIRGICDYCDMRKGDDWQNYAAAAAAGYLKSLLGKIDEVEKKRSTAIRASSVSPEAARTAASRVDALNNDEETLQRIDDTQIRLQGMLAEGGREAKLLIPTLSWVTSIDRKFHQDRLLAREAQSIEALHAELRRAGVGHVDTKMSPVERLALNLLEHYQTSEILRANWEVRCAIGNLLTLAVSSGQSNTSALITQVMHASGSSENWDLAQMLFDALHHAETLTKSGRDFLLTTAIEHEHRQVRWNVAAALKSIRVSEVDLRQILARLLQDPSNWVVKELIDVGLKNQKILAELSGPSNSAVVLNLLEQDPQLLEHVILSLGSSGRQNFLPQFTSLMSGFTVSQWVTQHLTDLNGDAASAGYSRVILQQDFRKVEDLKSQLRGQHGKLYKSAERVVLDRIRSRDSESQQSAITAYLHCTHDALAWASVRALFSGKLDGCSDAFLRRAVSDMLTHPSEWIRRECVEETLRLENSPRKYIALRQIEEYSGELAKVDEIRPYLVQIGMRFGD